MPSFILRTARRAAGLLLCLQYALAAPVVAAQEKPAWLGLPLEYAKQSYAFKGGPAVELERVRVLTSPAIEADRVWVRPDWSAWMTRFETQKVRLVAGAVTARPAALSRLGRVDGASTKRVTRLEFGSLKLLFGDTPLQLPAGEMLFADDGALTRIRVALGGGVSVELVPREGGRLGVLVQSGELRWPVLPAFRLDSMVAQGEMTDDQIVLDRIGANGDGGSLSGVIRLVSAGKFLLEGDLVMNSLRARDVIQRLYPRAVVDGVLSGNLRVASSADSFDGLGRAIAVEGTYELKSGSIDRFGLLEGMRRSGSGVVGGGLVRFDQLNGRFSGRSGANAQASFSNLVSGALRGASSFTLDPAGALRGTVSGSLVLPGGEVVSRRFVLSGKVDAPTLTAP